MKFRKARAAFLAEENIFIKIPLLKAFYWDCFVPFSHSNFSDRHLALS